MENLVCAGACDGLNRNRRQTFEAIETILRQASAAASERESAQVNLFGALDEGAGRSLALPAVPDWPIMERLNKEFEAIGFYLSAHPLDAYGQSLRRLEVVRHGDLPAWLAGRTGNRAKVAGIVIGRQERTSAKGNRFAFVQLSDTSGMFEALVFSETLSSSRELLEPGRIVLLTLDVRSEEDTLRLTVQSVQALDEAVAQSGAGLRIYLRDPAPVSSLKQLLERERRGKGRISFVLDLEGGREVEMALPGGFAVSAPTRAAIKAIPGIVEVQDL
jgi:DNA polymerase-3 subunit alpha